MTTRKKEQAVSGDGSSRSFVKQVLEDISNHDYLVWNAAYDRGYKSGRDYEAKMHSGLELTVTEVAAINKLAMSMGYISHEEHEPFLMLLDRLKGESWPIKS